jgi:hypothetical protein
MHVANPVVGGRGDTMQYLKSYMQTQVDANLFNDDEAMTILNNAEKSATETVLNREMVAAATSTDPTKVKEFTESLKSKTLFGKSLSSKTVAEFTDKAYRMSEKIKSQNQRDLFVTSAENMKKLVDNTLTDQEVDKQVMEEKMSPEIGAIWKASQANPDDWQTAVDDKVIKPASGSAQILMGIAQAVTDGKTDVSKTQILEIALKQYNAKKISKTDVAWILRSITEKDKNPDSPIWDSLKTAFAMGGAGAMRQFMSVWDFVKDPKKVMAGIKKDQAKQRFKNINLTDNEPDSVVDAFNLVHGYSIPPSSSTDDEGAEVDPYSGKEPD